MADMKDTPHYEASEASQTEHGANVHATLASAFETRTANLLALWESSLVDRLNDAERLELEQEILERSGMRNA